MKQAGFLWGGLTHFLMFSMMTVITIDSGEYGLGVILIFAVQHQEKPECYSIFCISH